jgi:L-amino acid N-acyltransferase YncA
MTIFRKAKDEDQEAILNIWLDGANFNLPNMVVSEEDKIAFIYNFTNRKDYEYVVCEKDEKVIGYQSFLPLTYNPLAKHIVESSTQVHRDFYNFGYGYKLLKFGFDQLEDTIVTLVFGFITEGKVTVKFAEKIGCELLGKFKSRPGQKMKLTYIKYINQ